MLNAMGGTPMGDPPPCLRPPRPTPARRGREAPARGGQHWPPACPVAAPAAPANAPPALVKFVQLVAPDYGLQPTSCWP